MPTYLDDILAQMTPDRRDRISAMSAQLAREEERLRRSEEPAPQAARFEIYRDKNGQFRFRLVSAAGDTMVSSEGYPSKESAMEAIALVRQAAPDAELVGAV